MADMSMGMFWGGAPQPLNTPAEAIAQLRKNEFTLHDDEDSDDDDLWNPATGYYNPQTGETGEIEEDDDEPGKKRKRRVPGGLAPVPKRITAEYDSDDARIIELKQQSYSDEFVAQKLKEEGRMRYVSKTIGSRWLRLRKVLEERGDQRLDDEMSDWHVGEDEILRDIKTEVDKKYALQIQRLEEKKWQEVSIYLADRTTKRKYTAKACRERLESLDNGTALPPIELDEDQEGRRALRANRIAAAKAYRASVEQEKKDLDAARTARAKEKVEAKEEAARQRQSEILRKQDEVKERKRIKDEKEATRLAARLAREQYMEKVRLERDWEAEKIRVEKVVFFRITGKHLFGKAAPRQRTSCGKKSNATNYEFGNDWDTEEEDHDEIEESASDDDADDEDDIDRTDSVANFNPKRVKRTPFQKRALPVRQARVSAVAAIRTAAPETDLESDDEVAVSVATTAQPQVFTKALVTRETLLNPRSICTNTELKRTFLRRDITPGRQENESHAEVVARLAAHDESLSVAQLREVCRSELLSPTGKKEQLVERLAEEDAANSFARTNHKLKSTEIEFMMTYEGYEGANRIYLEEAKEAARARGEVVPEDSDEDDI